MNPDKIAKIIKDIRVKNNLSQQKFADKYGVTYQAVSKWENAKSIPDLAILTKICNDYNLNLDEVLDNKKKKKKFIIILIPVILVIILILIFLLLNKNKDFEFKTLSTTCNNFSLYGSIAYNSDKMAIYIPNITYCGEENNDKYVKLECILYENHEYSKIVVSNYNYEGKEITLDEFLKQVNFKVDDYEKACKSYRENELYLEIRATDSDDNVTSYQIPLTFDDDCLN